MPTDDAIRTFARSVATSHPLVKQAIFCALGATNAGGEPATRLRALLVDFAKKKGVPSPTDTLAEGLRKAGIG